MEQKFKKAKVKYKEIEFFFFDEKEIEVDMYMKSTGNDLFAWVSVLLI